MNRFYSVRFVFLLLPVFFNMSLCAEQYKIRSVTYERTGRTTEASLVRAVIIDMNTVYANESDFQAKLSEYTKQFTNLRVLESVNIIPTFSSPDENALLFVDLRIVTVDTGNFIALPYPEYNSNTGFSIKLKMRDYDFLGSMQVFSGDVVYNFNKNNGTHSLGSGIDFSIPFKLGAFNSTWNNAYGVSYAFGNSTAQYNATTGLGVDLISVPKLGILTWSPGVSFSYDWDTTPFAGNSNEKFTHDTLIGKTVSFGHSLSTGHIDWSGNYRSGYAASIGENFDYHTDTNKIDQILNADISLYSALKYCGLSARMFVFANLDGITKVGNRIRGIKDDFIETDSAVLVSFDVPIKIFTTDWRSIGLPDVSKHVDFECQIAPFIDAAVGNNSLAKSGYNFRDGWYSLGLEVLGYPTGMRSIQGRLSAGFDLVQLGEKAGGKEWANSVWNTDWRNNPLYEIDIGIGLFY